MIAARQIFLWRGAGGALPSGYTAVDWLANPITTGSNGAFYQHPTTIALAQDSARVVINAVFGATQGSSWNVLFCNSSSDNQSGSINIRRYAGQSAIMGITGGSGSFSLTPLVPFVAEFDRNKFYIDGILVDSKSPSSTALDNPICIGHPLWSTRFWCGYYGRCQIWSADVLVADLYPCRDPNSVLGYYDGVAKTFAGSASQTNFNEGTLT